MYCILFTNYLTEQCASGDDGGGIDKLEISDTAC